MTRRSGCVGVAILVATSVGIGSCGFPRSGEVSAVRARPTEVVARWMSSSSEPLLDQAQLAPIDDPRQKFPSVGLAAYGLAFASTAPGDVVESYLSLEMPDTKISAGKPSSWMVPGIAEPFFLVPWTARSAGDGVGRGEALVFEGEDGLSVIEVGGDGVELGGLLMGALDDELTVSGYVALEQAKPFVVQVEVPNGASGVPATNVAQSANATNVAQSANATNVAQSANATNVAQSDGRSALIEATAPIGEVLVTRLRSEDPDAPNFSALITGSERLGIQPVSFIDRLRLGSVGFMFDPADRSASQSAQDAASQQVPADVAELPFARRVTPVGRASGGNYQAPIDASLRWSVSRLPNSVGGGAELLLIEGGVEAPATIRYAIELGEFRPSWVVATETHIYTGRRAENDPSAMVLRANLDGSEIAAVAQTETPDSLPPGWTAASAEQVDAINALINYAPDPAAVDAIIDGNA